LQATEVLKEILSLGDSLSGKLVIYDALAPAFRTVRIAKDPNCPCCSQGPTGT
jgi:adenylyltransferase/sulfurtransferase